LIISLIAAVDMSNGIARNGNIPWHLSDDLANFKRLTMGHHLLMGRKTFQTIGRKLPGRRIIILTRNAEFLAPNISVARSLSEGFDLSQLHGETELFIAGGGKVFTQTIDLAVRIYLTRVFTRADCDVFFPHIDQRQWKIVETWFHPQDLKNGHAFEFLRMEKRNDI
jgi:dihydrofolate reductase